MMGIISNKGVIFMYPGKNDLDICRSTDIMTCDPGDLVDLQDVHIDTSRPVCERMNTFLKQVGNPYLFKVDGMVVKATYLPQSNRRLCDTLPGLLSH